MAVGFGDRHVVLLGYRESNSGMPEAGHRVVRVGQAPNSIQLPAVGESIRKTGFYEILNCDPLAETDCREGRLPKR